MKTPVKGYKVWQWIACVSIVINLLIGFILCSGNIKSDKELNNTLPKEKEVEYDFRSNKYYDVYLTTFQLNHSTTDVVFLGDSITLGGMWSEFFPDVDVLNRGIGSDTSGGVLNRFDEVALHEPQKIFLMIGCNDIGKNIPQEKIVDNVESILNEAQNKLPQCEVYLQSLLPSNLEKDKVLSLNEAYRNLSEKYNNCSYIDLYSLFLNDNGNVRKECFGVDDVHLNGEGYTVWIHAISEMVY